MKLVSDPRGHRGTRRITDGGAVRYYDPDAPTYVYRFFDKAGSLLYVGVAFDPEERWQAHRHTEWWPQAVENTVVLYPSRRAALCEETRAIAEENPAFNHRPVGRATGHRQFARLSISQGGRLIALDPQGIEITRAATCPEGAARLDASLAEKCNDWTPGALVGFTAGPLSRDQVEAFNQSWERRPGRRPGGE